jgi:hypothetical protein
MHLVSCHTAFIYARARAEHARRLAAAALVAAAVVAPVAASAWDYTDTSRPAPRPAGHHVPSSSDTAPRGLTAAQYHAGMALAADQMANVQRGYLAGTISYAAYTAAQRQHAAKIKSLRAGLAAGQSSGSHGVGSNSSNPNDCRSRCN